jgi:hypothetical protein
MMHSSNRNACTPLPTSRTGWRRRPVEDVVYQLVTVGAILVVLGSLWVF